MPSAAEPRRADAFVVTMVTDGGAAGADAAALVARVVAAARAGVDVVQVREKALTDRALLGLVSAVRAGLASSATRLLVNGRPDVAVAAGADGVQVPEEGLPVSDVKRAFPSLTVILSSSLAALMAGMAFSAMIFGSYSLPQAFFAPNFSTARMSMTASPHP